MLIGTDLICSLLNIIVGENIQIEVDGIHWRFLLHSFSGMGSFVFLSFYFIF